MEEQKKEGHEKMHAEKHADGLKKQHESKKRPQSREEKIEHITELLSEHPKKKKAPSVNLEVIALVLAVAFLVIVLFNQYQIFSINSGIAQKELHAKEALKPAAIQLTVISDQKCSGCYDINPLVKSIQGNKNLNVTSAATLGFDDPKTISLIAKYSIKSLPTIVITGDIDKAHAQIQGVSKANDALFLANVPPPFYNPATKKVEGLISITYLADASCTECANISSFGTQLKTAGLALAQENHVDAASQEGKALVAKYSIQALPTIIMSQDAAAYPIMAQAWPQIGNVAPDGSYVMRTIAPPFRNVSTGKVAGIVDIILLSDKSCTACYDVTLHKQILTQGFAIKLGTVTETDVSDKAGKDLIAKYSITAVPTIIISGDGKYYPSFVQTWTSVGSTESDGSYIFRNFGAWPGHAFMNLTSGKVVENPQAQQNAG